MRSWHPIVDIELLSAHHFLNYSASAGAAVSRTEPGHVAACLATVAMSIMSCLAPNFASGADSVGCRQVDEDIVCQMLVQLARCDQSQTTFFSLLTVPEHGLVHVQHPLRSFLPRESEDVL